MFGRSLSVLGSRDDDIFMAGDLYIGAVGRNNAFACSSRAKGAGATTTRACGTAFSRTARAVEYLQVDSDHHDDVVARVQRRLAAAHSVQPLAQRSRRRRARIRVVEHAGRPAARRAVRGSRLRRVASVRADATSGSACSPTPGRLWAGDIPYGVIDAVSVVGRLQPPRRRPARRRRESGASTSSTRSTPKPAGTASSCGSATRTRRRSSSPSRRTSQATREHTVPSSVFRWPK